VKEPTDQRRLSVVHVAEDDDLELLGGGRRGSRWVETLIGQSHVSVAPQLLEGVFAFLVLRPAGALGRAVVAQLLHNLAHRARLRRDGEGARVAPDAAVPSSVRNWRSRAG